MSMPCGAAGITCRAWFAAIVLCGLLSAPVRAGVEIGKAAPDYLGLDREGRAVELSSLRGKVVVVSFWASWCPPCLKELPILENAQRLTGESRLRVVAVNIDDEPRNVRQMRRQLRDFRLLSSYDKDKRARKAYGAKMVPYMVMIDHLGNVAHIHVGYSEKALPAFVDEIKAVLEGAAPPTNALL